MSRKNEGFLKLVEIYAYIFEIEKKKEASPIRQLLFLPTMHKKENAIGKWEKRNSKLPT